MRPQFPEASYMACVLCHKGWKVGRGAGVTHLGAYGTLYFQNHSKGRTMHSWNCPHSFFITRTSDYSIKTRNWCVLGWGGGRERERCFCLWYEMWYNVFQDRRWLQMRRNRKCNWGGEWGLSQFSGARFHFCLPFSSSQTLQPNYPCCKAEPELSFRVLKMFFKLHR